MRAPETDPSAAAAGKLRVTRRRALAATASAGLVVAGEAGAETIRQKAPWAADLADRPDQLDTRPGYIFFTPGEAAFVEAAVARLIPQDELGPGALEAGVPRFIDRQLAGPYGQGDHFNLQRPMPKGTPSQGWQMGAPAEVYRAAIPQVDRWATETKGKGFAALSPDDRDAALKALESGQAQLKNLASGEQRAVSLDLIAEALGG